MSNGPGFCLYGVFEWPPSPKAADRTEGTSTGAVVLRFAEHPKVPGSQAAWMSWIPAELLRDINSFSDLPPADSSVPDLFSAGAEVWQDFDSGSIKSLWLYDGPNYPEGEEKPKPSTGERLWFTGGWLLDVFNISMAGAPDLRLPLARNFGLAETEGQQSRLIFGQSTNTNFRFDLGLPLPVEQTNRTGWANAPVFVFSALYRPEPEAGTDPMVIDTVVAGRKANKHKLLGADNLPERKTRLLGSFGFAIGSDDREKFANFKGIAGKHDHWPVSSQQPVLGAISGMGFGVEKRTSYQFLTTRGLTSSDDTELSISFGASPRGDRHVLRYRLRQKVAVGGAHIAPGGEDDVVRRDRSITSSVKVLHFRFRHDLGKWLNAETTALDTEIGWSWEKAQDDPGGTMSALADDKVNGLLAPQIAATLSWEQAVPGDLGRDAAAATLPPETERFGLIDGAIRSMRAARIALQQAEGAQPQSFLPEMQLRKADNASTVRFVLYPQDLRAKLNADGLLDWANPAPDLPGRAQFRLSLAPCPHGKCEDRRLFFRSWFPSVLGAAPGDGRHSHLFLAHDEEAVKGGAGDIALATYRIRNDTDRNEIGDEAHKAGHRKRAYLLGALEFQRDRPAVVIEDGGALYSQLAISRGPVTPQRIGSLDTVLTAPLGVALQLRMAVDKVLPRTVDLPRGSRTGRPAPILIPDALPDDTESLQPNFILDIAERLDDRSDWSLTARLTDQSAAVTGQEIGYVVVSQQPFGLFRFFRAPLGEQGDAGRAIVAEYDSVTRNWQFLNTASYRYTLPAQSLGEGADKPRRLELHDPMPEDLDAHRPYPLTDNMGARNDASFLVDYRLTPPADVWINPSDVERGFALPEWSAHDIFRQRGAFGLGVALQGFRAEYLYGMPVGVDTGRETGPGQTARVAEIEALTGEILDANNQNAPYPLFDQRWKAVQLSLRTRPERLEVWTLDATSDRPFGAARFTDGAAYALRHTALHRPAIEATGDPAGADLPADPLPGTGLRYHEHGLGGGAIWPLESRNFFDRLVTQPESAGGTIERVALSPLGGDADQTAAFLNGTVKVISQTRNGRIQRQRIEIIGRIAAFWHRAKHVVVYERSVNASAQFAPDIDLANPEGHTTRTRRPVLRKVEEYVELLERSRSYPDFEGTPTKTIGFLDSVRFNSQIIHVDSAWSEDVGKEGWKIPLWNRHAARRRPKVYPRPDISFVTVAEGDGERPLIAQECRDPENIFFFAEVLSNPDTDSWRPYLGVDYANVIEASQMLGWQNAMAGNQEAGRYDSPRARNAGRILPGYRRFTWRLTPAGARTRLNAERGLKPIYAGLESVTFMRAALQQMPDDDTAKDTTVRKMRELLVAAGGVAGLGEGAPPIWTQRRPPDGMQPERDLWETIREAVKASDPQAAGDAFAEWEKFPAVATLLASGLGDFVDGLPAKFKELGAKGKEVEDTIEGIGSKCDKLKDRARREIQTKRRLIAEDIRDFRVLMADAGIPKTTKADLVEAWSRQLALRLDELLDPARADVGNARAGIETIRAAVDDAETDIDAVLRAAERRVDQLIASYNAAKPWSDARMDELLAKLAQEFRAIWNDVEAAIDEARQRITTELDDTAQRIGAAAAKLLGDIARAKLQSLTELNGASAAVRGALSQANAATVRADKALKKAADAADKGFKTSGKTIYADAKKTIVAAQGLVDGLKNLIDDASAVTANTTSELRVKILQIEAKAAETIVAVRNALITEVGWIDELAEDGFDALSEELDELKDDLEAALQAFSDWAQDIASKAFDYLLHVLVPLRNWLDVELRGAITAAATINAELMEDIDGLAGLIDVQVQALQDALSGTKDVPSPVAEAIRQAVFLPALQHVLAPITEADVQNLQNGHARVLGQLDQLADEAEARLEKLSQDAVGTIDALNEACQAISAGAEQIRGYLERELDKLTDDLQKIYDGTELKTAIDEFVKGAIDARAVLKELEVFDAKVTSLYNDAAATAEYGKAYADRVLDEAAKLENGGLGAAPNNLLRLYSAATSAPELAMLQTNIDRMRTTFREAEDFIRSSKAKALLGRLGDALKAMGLDLPFDELGDQFRIRKDDLANLDLSKMFRNFGGLKLDGLFDGVKLPEDVRTSIDTYIKISHDFDRKAARAWVQVDVDVPVRGTRTLFEIGPFKANLRNSTLIGRLRLEASKDTERVQETGNAVIATEIELQVAGQTTVTLERVALRFSKEGGMDFEFDPKRIRLNPAFQFIQDTLGQLFPDEFGGLQVIKQNGIPVGLEHLFTMPPVSLNFGTSGVSNIAISNRFRLLAFPDFIISDRFNLNRVEQPFIFSIFIIGGTGYIQIDTEYRPFDKRLSVLVEAAVGGSAALAFAFGPVSGGVYITLSIALTYRKVIGSPEGGLSVGVVLVIAGNVSLWGMVTILLTLMLRMTYHDDGRIDALGSLSVEVRVSRFFKLKFRTTVTYQLRGGRETTMVTSNTETEIDPELKKKADRLKQLRKKLS